eukprot:2345944-Pyramimonas_sp.AAC.1
MSSSVGEGSSLSPIVRATPPMRTPRITVGPRLAFLGARSMHSDKSFRSAAVVQTTSTSQRLHANS